MNMVKMKLADLNTELTEEELRELDAAEAAFVDYIFSDTGRAIVIENGYIPAY